jgi:hypothetical protein
MSVLLFMPTSGGSPLESIILTSHEDDGGEQLDAGSSDTHDGSTSSNHHHHHHRPQVVSRFDMENGRPVRKLSSDTASSWSEDEQNGPSTGPGESTNMEPNCHVTSSNHMMHHKKMPPGRSRSTGTSKSASSSLSRGGQWNNVNSSRLSRSTSPLLHRDSERGDSPTIDVHNGILV